SACRLQNYLLNLIDYGPLWPSSKIVFEIFNAACRSFRERLNTAVSTVAHVANNLMPRRCSLRKEAIPDSLNVTFNKKPSCYLHLKSSPSFPFSNVNVSSSASLILRLSVIVLPLIDPV